MDGEDSRHDTGRGGRANADMKELTSVDKEGWKAEIPMIKEHFAIFGSKLPKALNDELTSLEKRLG